MGSLALWYLGGVFEVVFLKGGCIWERSCANSKSSRPSQSPTKEGLSTIVSGMEISRGIFRRMKSFLTYRIAATLQLLTFFFIALFAFKPVHWLPADPIRPPPHVAHKVCTHDDRKWFAAIPPVRA